MRSYTEAFYNAVTADTRSLFAKIEWTDAEGAAHTLSADDYLIDFKLTSPNTNGLFFGYSISQGLEFTVLAEGTVPDIDDAITLKIGPNSADLDDFVSTQIFYVSSVETDTKSGEWTITAYDRMAKANELTWANYTGTKTGTVTINALIQGIAAYLGLLSMFDGTNGSASYTFDTDLYIEDSTTIRQVINAIAEVTGTIAFIKKDGESQNLFFRKLSFGSTDTKTPITRNLIYEAEQGNSVTLTGIAHSNEGNDTVQVGSSTGYVQAIINNVFLTNISDTDIQARLNAIYNNLYLYNASTLIAYDLDWLGNCILEPGDAVRIYTDESNYFDTLYAGETLDYNGGLRSTATWETDTNTTAPEVANDVSTAIRTTSIRVDKANQKISVVVDNDNVIKAASIVASINNGSSEIKITAEHINLDGVTTFVKPEDLSTEGQTVINGGNITTGSVSADRISGGTLSGSSININDNFMVDSDGNMTANKGVFKGDVDSSGSVITTGAVNAGIITGTSISGDTISGTNANFTNIDSSSLTVANIALTETGTEKEVTRTATITATFSAGVLQGQYAIFRATATSSLPLNASTTITVRGRYKTSSSASWTYQNVTVTIYKGQTKGSSSITDSSITSIYDYGLYMFSPQTVSWTDTSTGTGLAISGDFVPATTGTYDLGSSDLKWNDIYAVNSTIQTSDRNMKKDIAALDNKYSDFFDKLEPVSYKFVDNTSDRTHVGLIAQDVLTALTEADLTSQDFAGFVKSTDDQGNEYYGLRYGEFIGLLIHEVQALKAEIKSLKGGTD